MAALPPPSSFSVTGKTAIITGAGSGINFCFAELLLARNCNVIIADLALRPEAQSLVDAHSVKDDSKPRAVFVQTDVTNWDALTNIFDVADREFGGADIVCPGAGVFEPHWSNFWHPPGSALSKDSVHGTDGLGHYATLDINLTHPIRTTQLAIARWLHSSHQQDPSLPVSPKRIVHISSIAAQGSGINVPLYIASKAGLSSFVRCLGDLEATRGIRVTAVAPGLIRTPLWTEHPEKLQMFDAARDTWVEPADVAAQMLRCCEDPEIPGGCVLEVTAGATRRVAVLNDPGPSLVGGSVSNGAVVRAEVYEWLSKPGWGMPI